MSVKYADVKRPRCPLSGSAWDPRSSSRCPPESVTEKADRQRGAARRRRPHGAKPGAGETTGLPPALTGETLFRRGVILTSPIWELGPLRSQEFSVVFN